MKSLKVCVALCVSILFSSASYSALIVDAEFEPNMNGLSSTGGWYSTSSQVSFFGGQANLEGGYVSHSNPSHTTLTSDISNGAHTIQEGIYTILFAAGNWSNAQFTGFDITFGGMNQSLASTFSASSPNLGQWELWSFTWDVASNSSFIGNSLSFKAVALNPGSSNGALDGVGSLSSLGNGFLVDYADTSSSQAVPEPSTLAIFALGILGLASRRLKKQS